MGKRAEQLGEGARELLGVEAQLSLSEGAVAETGLADADRLARWCGNFLLLWGTTN